MVSLRPTTQTLIFAFNGAQIHDTPDGEVLTLAGVPCVQVASKDYSLITYVTRESVAQRMEW